MPRSCAYLTIDDSPSSHTDELTDFLADHDIPALLFCRGDRLAESPEPVVRAIQKGFCIGNHAYTHRRASELSFAEMVDEIERTEALIDKAYKHAGAGRSVQTFRFPHMDRGCGGWVVDYDAVPDEYRKILIKLFVEGLNISLSPPHEEQREKKQNLQEYLKAEGFVSPFRGVNHKWYAETEMAEAIDAMFTFSASDWMLTPRHQSKWPYKSLDDLKQKIDDDPWLKAEDSHHILLFHDQDGLLDVTMALITHCKDKMTGFLEI